MKTLKEMREKLAGIEGEQNAINAKANAEERDLSADEWDQLRALNKEFETEQSRYAIQEAIEENQKFLNASKGKPVPSSMANPPSERSASQKADPTSKKIGSLGRYAQAISRRQSGPDEFMQAVREGSLSAARQRLGTKDDTETLKIDSSAASTFASEALDSEGGLLIPPDYSNDITTAIASPDSLLSQCNPVPVNGNSMVFPVDETTPWGTAGAQAYWQQEGTAVTASKPVGEPRSLRLKKLMCMIPVTNELLQDANALESWITQSVASRFNYKIADAIVNGLGGPQPVGFGTAASLVVQATSGGGANTIKAADVSGMFSKMIPEAVSGAVWIVSPTAWAQLPLMVIGQQPVWQPDFRVSPGGTLLGRPVIVSVTCQALGTQGDIYLANLKMGYACIIKSGGVNQAISAHLYFDADQSAFRFTFRMDGMPWLKAAPTVPKGGASIGHFIAFSSTRT